MDGHDGRYDEDGKRNKPVTGERADRQAQDHIDNMGAADRNQMNETVIHRLVRRQVVALRRRVFGLRVIRHSILQEPLKIGSRGLAQMHAEGNVAPAPGDVRALPRPLPAATAEATLAVLAVNDRRQPCRARRRRAPWSADRSRGAVRSPRWLH
jgi:hypothetical protein